MLCAVERGFSCQPEGLSNFSGGSVSKEFACNAGDMGSIPGSERSPEERNDFPLQHSFLRSPMDRGIWWSIVHGHKELDIIHRDTVERMLFALKSVVT